MFSPVRSALVQPSFTSEHLASLHYSVQYNWSGSRFQSRDGLYHGSYTQALRLHVGRGEREGGRG